MPRQIAMYLLQSLTTRRCRRSPAAFSGKHHYDGPYSIRSVEDRRKTAWISTPDLQFSELSVGRRLFHRLTVDWDDFPAIQGIEGASKAIFFQPHIWQS